ncbi:MAG: hypothetical protein RI885_383 [Actinomycetota bacterium]|jgi:N,N'-diacetylchitobiose transport system permease protein
MSLGTQPGAVVERLRAEGGSPPPPRIPGRTRSTTRRRTAPLALLIPSAVILAAIIGWPLVQLVVMSFQEFGRAQVFGRPAPFIGFDNYAAVLADAEFWQVLGRSLAFCAVNVVTAMSLGTLIAMLMQRLPRFFRLLVSVGLLLAWAMPALTAVVVWGWMFDTQFGVVNYVITEVTGLDYTNHSWLIEPLSFFAVATMIVTWQSVPFVAFMIYAGLTQVPADVIEAAQLDGAGYVARFRFIVAPMLKGVFLIVTILQVIWDLRVFTQIFALQGIGGLREQTSTIGVYIVKKSIGTGEFGTGAAIAVILVIVMLLISAHYIRSNLREEAS